VFNPNEPNEASNYKKSTIYAESPEDLNQINKSHSLREEEVKSALTRGKGGDVS